MSTETENEINDDDMRSWEHEESILSMFLGSPALAKSCLDKPFDYALKLRSGQVIAFEGAKVLNKEWIHLEVKDTSYQPGANPLEFRGARGMDVRISEIVWVMDAPNGS